MEGYSPRRQPLNIAFALISALIASFFSSCANQEQTPGEQLLPEGARQTDLQTSDKYNWMKKVNIGEDGTVTGGTRSRYDNAASLDHYRKNYDAPEYTRKNYHRTAWSGKKDYSAGSYQGKKSSNYSQKKSWFGGSKSQASGKKSNLASRGYDTQGYQTTGAREAGQARVSSERNAKVQERRQIWGWSAPVYSAEQYRQLTVKQTRSLLGKD